MHEWYYSKNPLSFQKLPPIDYLLIPGGTGRLKEIENKEIISFIQKQAENAEYILSVCTGMFLLHKAGLLNHQSITTYWRALPEAILLSDVHIVEERIVKNDKIWLAGGISSGIDLALEFISEIAGNETAGKVQLLFEYFPKQHTYYTPELLHSLPLYYGNEANQTHLPKYVDRYLENEKK